MVELTQTRFLEAPKGAITTDSQPDFFNRPVLFYIERSMNTNTVVYVANVGMDGKLDQKEPLKVYWLMYEKSPVVEEPLNMVERNTAYGMSVSPCPGKDGHYIVTLSALKDRQIEIWLDETGLHAITTVAEKDCELLCINVNLKANWMGIPKVQFLDVRGMHMDGVQMAERIESK